VILIVSRTELDRDAWRDFLERTRAAWLSGRRSADSGPKLP
jgi:hypothetical protein